MINGHSAQRFSTVSLAASSREPSAASDKKEAAALARPRSPTADVSESGVPSPPATARAVNPGLVEARFVEARIAKPAPARGTSANLTRAQAERNNFGPRVTGHYQAFLQANGLSDQVGTRISYLNRVYETLGKLKPADRSPVDTADKRVFTAVLRTGFGNDFPVLFAYRPGTHEVAWMEEAADKSHDAAAVHRLQTAWSRCAGNMAAQARKAESRGEAARAEYRRLQRQPDEAFFTATGLAACDVPSSTSSSSSSTSQSS